MTLEFTIPGRPTAWQRSVTSKGVRYTPPDMRAAQKFIKQLATIAMLPAQPMVGPLRLEVLCIYAIPPSWTKAKQATARAGKVWKTTTPDHDNLVKQISDALNGIAYADDAQIVVSQVGKRYGYPERTEVRIRQLDVLCDHSPKGAFRDMAATLAGQDSLPGLPAIASNTLSTRPGK